MKKIVNLFIVLIFIFSFAYGVSAQLGDVTPAPEREQFSLRETLLKLFNVGLDGENEPTKAPTITPTPPSSIGGQQQGTLNFSGSATPPPQSTSQSGVQQVDWVYEGQGVCWSAWTVGGICTLFSHEGGVTTQSMKDLNHDGTVDIECSEGNGSRQATSIKNISSSPITINCERYSCASCTSGNGSHAQCDGGIDERAIRVSEQVVLTPGCTATCTASGVTGSCLQTPDNPDNPNNPSPTLLPNTTASPTATPIPSPDFPGLTPTTSVPPNPPSQNSPTVIPSGVSPTPDFKTEITETQIKEILQNLVDDDKISGFDQKQTRLTGTAGFETEMNYLLKLFIEAGIQAEIQNATGVDAQYVNMVCPKDVSIFNLIARIPGRSNNKYLLTAHLDSREQNFDPALPAPGADRNGSGASAVVAAALALAGQQPENTIEFVLFGGTEQGLCGSAFYMQTAKNTNQNILGVINLDMMGNAEAGGAQCINIGYLNPAGKSIVDRIESVRGRLATDLTVKSFSTNLDASNHKHFHDNGIPVSVIIECNINNRYFTQNDTLVDESGNEILSISQIVMTAQVAAATMLELAQTSGTPNPSVTITQPVGQSPVPTTPQAPSPTLRPAGSLLPVMFHTYIYEEEVNEYPPTFIYGNLNRAYSASKADREIRGLAAINGNVTKMLLVSEYAALEQILNNHGDDIRAAGITWIGLNAERDGRTPDDDLSNIFTTNAETNTLNRMGRLVAQYGLKLMFGPTTPMWNQYFKGQEGDVDQIANAMFGDNCALDGIAFQEQNQLGSSGDATGRKDVVADRTKFFREHPASCDDFEVTVQIMPQQCEQNLSWEQCREFYRMLSDLTGDKRVDSLGIWANPNDSEKATALEFIRFLRQ